MEDMHPDIKRKLDQNNGVIFTKDVILMGHSKQLLTNYCKAGLLERVQQGIYVLPNSPVQFDNHYLIMCHSPYIVFSHATALYLSGIGNDYCRYLITLPNNKMMPRSIKLDCMAFYVNPKLHAVGLTHSKTEFGQMVRHYDIERTICDYVRTDRRFFFKEDDVFDVIRICFASVEIDVQKMFDYANFFGIKKILRKYLLDVTESYSCPIPNPESFLLYEKNIFNLLLHYR